MCKYINYNYTTMTIVLNLNTREYFITNNKIDQNEYFKKLLNHNSSTLLDWKCVSSYTSFKSVIEWNRLDKIIVVPQEIEPYILNNKKYQYISRNYSGNALW